MTDVDVGRRNEEALRQFVERMAMTFAHWGFPRMAARVLITLMAAEEDSLSAGELGERLGVSPAAISGAVRYLIQIGILIREPVAGARSDRYRLPDDAWYTATATESRILKDLAGLAEDGVDALGERSPAGRRVAEMRDFFLFLADEMESLREKWEAHQARQANQPRRPS